MRGGEVEKSMAASIVTPRGTESPNSTTRLNLNLPKSARGELDALVKDTGWNITELVRISLGFLKVFIEEARQGNKLIVTTSNGKPIKELVFPGL